MSSFPKDSIKRLIVNECANWWDGGHGGRKGSCKQHNAESLCCAYFVERVLPLNKALKAELAELAEPSEAEASSPAAESAAS